MPRGYYDQKGEFVETGSLDDLTWGNIIRAPKPSGWQCSKCFVQMKLLPINHDLPAEYWTCDQCQKRITIQERDAVFQEVIEAIAEKYILKTFSYDRQNNQWSIESAEWTNDYGTRLDAKQRRISAGIRDDIIDECLDSIEDTLQIQFNSYKGLLQGLTRVTTTHIKNAKSIKYSDTSVSKQAHLGEWHLFDGCRITSYVYVRINDDNKK